MGGSLLIFTLALSFAFFIEDHRPLSLNILVQEASR
jgi:hypothetical protein